MAKWSGEKIKRVKEEYILRMSSQGYTFESPLTEL